MQPGENGPALVIERLSEGESVDQALSLWQLPAGEKNKGGASSGTKRAKH